MSDAEAADSCPAYLKSLSQRQADQADCVLVCKDGTELICHSLYLFPASPVLAALEDTSQVDEKYRIPLNANAQLGGDLLAWLYLRRLPVAHTEDALHKLANLSAFLDLPCETPPTL